MKSQSVKKSKSNYSLLLVIFLFICSFSNLYSQTKDTLWTRDVWPLYVINGVFSPDDNFIYATGASDSYGKGPFTVLKYDLQGNLLTKIDSIGGIRQFSEDGRFFWNYYGDKYDAQNNQRISRVVDNLGRTNINFGASVINEKTDVGIIYDGGNVVKTSDYQYIFHNLVLFHPSDMSIISDTSYPNGIYDFYSVSIHPTNGKMALYLHDSRWNEKVSTYTSKVEKIEIWDVKTLTKEREIMTRNIGQDEHEAIGFLKYSPDGSVLGYQHDGKLTLYSTSDYSIIWENDNRFSLINNFIWSNDMQNFYLSFYTNKTSMGLCKLDFQNKSLKIVYKPSSGNYFINLNKALSLIVTHWGNSLELLDNTITSVADPVFTENYKTSIIQNQTNSDLILSINAIQPNIAEYTVTNSLGKICTKPITLNLEQGQNNFGINVSNLNSGIYFLNLTIEQCTTNLKFMLVR